MRSVAAIRKSDVFSVGKFGTAVHTSTKRASPDLYIHLQSTTQGFPRRALAEHMPCLPCGAKIRHCVFLCTVLNTVEGNQWGRPRALV